MVSAMATISTMSKIICCCVAWIPKYSIEARITATIIVPTAVLTTPPTPPVYGVPPTRTATMAGRRNPLAIAGAPPDSLIANMNPATAASPPEMAKASTL